MATVKSIIETARNSRNENGVAYLAAKDVAVLVRAALKKAFPGVKFSVRSDYSGIDVSWVDGPRSGEVSEIINQFSFGGFDGSIDMTYSSRNWLLPSGEMVPAESQGTCGSMGRVQGYVTDCPQAGAVLVGSGVKYMGPIATCRPNIPKSCESGRLSITESKTAAKAAGECTTTANHSTSGWIVSKSRA